MNPIHHKEFPQGSFQVYDQRPDFEVINCHQTHSNLVVEYKGESLEDVQADGIILDPKVYPNIIIGAKTADCLPVLFIGEKIAMVHAGWKGVQNQILLDPQIKTLKVHTIYIGPSIHSYEIQEEFKANFPESSNFSHSEAKIFFDLQQEAISQLSEGFPQAKVLNSDICTLDNNSYNSYRRNQTKQRNWNIFKIK